jgi:hypothetical protein
MARFPFKKRARSTWLRQKAKRNKLRNAVYEDFVNGNSQNQGLVVKPDDLEVNTIEREELSATTKNIFGYASKMSGTCVMHALI